MLCKKSTKMTSKSKQNRQKTQKTERQKTIFFKGVDRKYRLI